MYGEAEPYDGGARPGSQGISGGGEDFSELSEKYGTTAQVVRSWVKRYQEMGVAGLEDRRGKRLASQTPRTAEEALRIEKSRLVRENYLLKMELDLLKKVQELERGDR
ncbi:MAG: helix-turn-helix domain-containing protein [Oscillospiraceae bacterium]|nr:helix-turn-helix domain-containing protein [Oscillospiraceae bacterium]